MSVAVWNCQSWRLNVNTGGIYLTAYLGTSSKNFDSYLILVMSSVKFWSWGWGISDSLSGYLIWKSELTCDPGHFIWQGMGGYIWQLIWVLHLKIWTHISSWLLHLTIYGGYIWPSWALHLKSWPAKMSCNNNITYYTWQIWVLIVEISVIISVAMWYCPCWLLDVSSNMKLPFLTTRCQ